jgi:flagellin
LTLASIGLVASNGETANGRAIALTALSPGDPMTILNAGVNLVSDKAFTVSAGSSSTSLAALRTLGFTEGTFGGSNNGTKISSVDISTVAGANDALGAVDAALGQISDQRSNLGAIQNRLQAAVDNLTSTSTNLQAAQGRIQDTDYSVTTTQMSKSQIISQAATAMLAQANQQPQMVLSLLK